MLIELPIPVLYYLWIVEIVHSSPAHIGRFARNRFIDTEQHCLEQEVSGSSKIGMGKMATVKIAVMYGLLQLNARMLLSLDARKTLILFVFGTSVHNPGAKAVVPQWTVVALNPLPRLWMLTPSS